MKQILPIALAIVLTTFSTHAEPVEPPTESTVAKVDDFRLIDQNDRSIQLYHAAEAPAVVLYIHGVACPIVRRSIPELNRLHESFAPKGVVFYMLNANSQDERSDLAEEAQEFDLKIPILKDTTQRIAHSLGCKRTAEAIVLDPKRDWQIMYRGPVDDRFDYGTQKEEAENKYLENALNTILAGGTIATPSIEPKGCLINYLQEDKVSYANVVAPILKAKCVNCHVDGGVGPFAMSSYKKVRGWADMMRETLRTHRMPPWHADPKYKSFHNTLDLSVEERRSLLAWIEQGAQQDGEEDPLAMVASKGERAWTLGEPDHVVQLPNPEKLSASGVFDYRYIAVPSGLTENKWLRGVEVMPTQEEAVHHALIFIRYPADYRHLEPDPKGGLDGFFASYLPGGNLQPFPEGTAQFAPAGATFVFQMHYNSTGKEETDQTRMALYFNDGPPKEVFQIRGAADTEFRIPPRAKDFPAEATFRVREDMTLLGLAPHMHYRGSRFRYDAVYNDDRKETLLSVPWYEFDWQPMYYFDNPIKLAKGTRIQCTGAFDNSAFNPRNPDPDASVTFGEQSFEEMFIGYVCYSQPYRAEDYQPRDANPDGWAGFGKPLTSETLAGTTWTVGNRFQLRFEAGGKVTANDQFSGEWELTGETLQLKMPNREFSLEVVNDELFMRGRPLTRVPEGTAKE